MVKFAFVKIKEIKGRKVIEELHEVNRETILGILIGKRFGQKGVLDNHLDIMAEELSNYLAKYRWRLRPFVTKKRLKKKLKELIIEHFDTINFGTELTQKLYEESVWIK